MALLAADYVGAPLLSSWSKGHLMPSGALQLLLLLRLCWRP